LGKVGIIFYGGLARVTGEKTAHVSGSTVKEVLNLLTARYGERLEGRIYDGDGKLRRFVNIYINGKDIRFLSQLDSELDDGDEISIIPAVGGG